MSTEASKTTAKPPTGSTAPLKLPMTNDRQRVLPAARMGMDAAKALIERMGGCHIRLDMETIPGVVPNLLRLPAGCSFSLRCGQCGANCEKNMPELLETEPDHRVRCFLTEKEDAE